jgi:uncharacterized protein
MPWWLVIPAAFAATKIVLDRLQESRAAAGGLVCPPGVPSLEVRGPVHGNKIVVLGRTGAGKSSLINALKGHQVLPVGDIGSTTRWLEGVEIEISGSRVLLIDSPGIGEAQTHDTYLRAITSWCRLYRESIKGFLVVLQADAKGHSEDKSFLDALLTEVPDALILIALSQADKVKPSREPFLTDAWFSEVQIPSPKVANIVEKIAVIKQQFGMPSTAIVPIATEGESFNLDSLRAGLLSFPS